MALTVRWRLAMTTGAIFLLTLFRVEIETAAMPTTKCMNRRQEGAMRSLWVGTGAGSVLVAFGGGWLVGMIQPNLLPAREPIVATSTATTEATSSSAAPSAGLEAAGDRSWGTLPRNFRDLKFGSVTTPNSMNSSCEAWKLLFRGKQYRVVLDYHGMGQSYYTMGVYAPEKDGTYLLCAQASSVGAGHIEVEFDEEAGTVIFLEGANSRLKGQELLTCNLLAIGTNHSVHCR